MDYHGDLNGDLLRQWWTQRARASAGPGVPAIRF